MCQWRSSSRSVKLRCSRRECIHSNGRVKVSFLPKHPSTKNPCFASTRNLSQFEWYANQYPLSPYRFEIVTAALTDLSVLQYRARLFLTRGTYLAASAVMMFVRGSEITSCDVRCCFGLSIPC